MATMTGSKEQGHLRRLQVEVHGPRDHLDSRRHRRLYVWVSRLRHPWDVLLAFGIIGGLIGFTLLGTLVVIWSWTWIPGIISGIAMVAIAAGVSSHLASRWGV